MIRHFKLTVIALVTVSSDNIAPVQFLFVRLKAFWVFTFRAFS